MAFQSAPPPTITIQVANEQGQRRELSCSLQSFEKHRLILTTAEPVLPTTLLSAKQDDALLLGEVITCSQIAEAQWTLHVRVEQILTGLQTILTLRAQLLGEPLPHRSRTPTAH